MEKEFVILAFDTRTNSWDYCGYSGSREMADKHARGLAIGSIITFVKEGFVSPHVKLKPHDITNVYRCDF